MRRRDWKNPSYARGVASPPPPPPPPPPPTPPTDSTPPAPLCCIRDRTTCDGYVIALAKIFDATPSHAHSSALGSRVAFPLPLASRRVAASFSRSYAVNCSAPCETKTSDGVIPLYSPPMPSARAIVRSASTNPAYGFAPFPAPAAAAAAGMASAATRRCSVIRVFTTQIGFVIKLTTSPASAAAAKCAWEGNSVASSYRRRHRALAAP
eukprot:31286-Pelagococcus_subviridis.AAC.15